MPSPRAKEMPATMGPVLCIPAECDTTPRFNNPNYTNNDVAFRWNAYLSHIICRHFASVMLHFASLISHNRSEIPAYTHLIPTGLYKTLFTKYYLKSKRVFISFFMKKSYICNMANTYYQLYYHIVFAVSNREATIMESWREELYKYITGAIRNQGCELIAIGGMADHIHILVQIPPKITISSFVQSLKIQSTNWINEKHFCKGKFGWQEGYGAFTASRSHVPQIKNYIFNQKSHHKQKAFVEEYITMLNGYGVEYNKDYIFKPL